MNVADNCFYTYVLQEVPSVTQHQPKFNEFDIFILKDPLLGSIERGSLCML